MICSGRRYYRVSLNIQNATSTLQICESRPLGVNVNNLIYIRPDPCGLSAMESALCYGITKY